MQNDLLLVYVTCADEKEALSLSQLLLKEKLIACANYFPIKSLFNWQGNVENTQEYTLILKTNQTMYPKMSKTILEQHSYETPCIVALPIIDGNQDYINWIEDSLS